MAELNRISTGGGDRGETSLTDGSRVEKCSPRVCAYGTVDELNSWLGLVRSEELPASLAEQLLRIQHELFDLGGELATPAGSAVAQRIPQIGPAQVERLEEELAAVNARLQPSRNFILPGGSRAAAQLHLARTVARRAERELVALAASGVQLNPCCLSYLNRLSDLCFVWARLCNNGGRDDQLWHPDRAR